MCLCFVCLASVPKAEVRLLMRLLVQKTDFLRVFQARSMSNDECPRLNDEVKPRKVRGTSTERGNEKQKRLRGTPNAHGSPLAAPV